MVEVKKKKKEKATFSEDKQTGDFTAFGKTFNKDGVIKNANVAGEYKTAKGTTIPEKKDREFYLGGEKVTETQYLQAKGTIGGAGVNPFTNQYIDPALERYRQKDILLAQEAAKNQGGFLQPDTLARLQQQQAEQAQQLETIGQVTPTEETPLLAEAGSEQAKQDFREAIEQTRSRQIETAAEIKIKELTKGLGENKVLDTFTLLRIARLQFNKKLAQAISYGVAYSKYGSDVFPVAGAVKKYITGPRAYSGLKSNLSTWTSMAKSEQKLVAAGIKTPQEAQADLDEMLLHVSDLEAQIKREIILNPQLARNGRAEEIQAQILKSRKEIYLAKANMVNAAAGQQTPESTADILDEYNELLSQLQET